MYKIYINGTPVHLITKGESIDIPLASEDFLHVRYLDKTKHILQIVDMLEKTHRWKGVAIFEGASGRLWKDFKSLFKIIRAAGGLVLNDEKEALWIYRRGSWDLPKGKIDPGEKKRAAAIREVQEETGIEQVQIDTKLVTTFQTYRLKNGKRVLKKSFWYLMNSTDKTLVPQYEEDIEQAIWADVEHGLNQKEPVYGNIVDVVKSYLAWRGKNN